MKSTHEVENDMVNEHEQSSIDPPAVAPNLEQVQGAVDDAREAVSIDEDVSPVEATRE